MKRVLRSIYGQYVGTVDDFRVLHEKGIIIGEWGDQMPVASFKDVVQFDDFLGVTMSTQWNAIKGTDGAAANFAIVAGASGTAKGTTGASTTTMAGSGIQISGQLNFKAQGTPGTASSNNLEFNAKLQVDVITNQCVFVGFTNEEGTLQMPIQGSGAGNAFTGNANDAVGFVYDTTMTNPAWWCIGNAATVLATGQNSGIVPVAATYAVLAISVDQNGAANFFINGNQVGVTMPGAVTPTVALTPVIAAFNRTAAASRNFTVDRIMASMSRI